MQRQGALADASLAGPYGHEMTHPGEPVGDAGALLGNLLEDPGPSVADDVVVALHSLMRSTLAAIARPLYTGLSDAATIGVPVRLSHRSVLRQLRLVALLEGTSFLALLFIAMPLKYLAGLPLAVRIVGSVHGVLFLMFMAALYRAGRERGWPPRRWLIALVSSVVPFGTFMFDRSLRREIAEVTPGTYQGPGA